MKRQPSTQQRNNLTPPRINTPNNQEFIQDYFSAHQPHQPSPFSPAKNIDNNMFNGMYYPNNQMIPNNGPMYNNGIEGVESYDIKDNNKQKWDPRGMPTPSTPIHTMNDMNQFNVQMQYRNYDMYGDHQHQQPLMTPPPYIRNNVSFMNGGHHGNEEMMVGMNHVLKDQNSNLLSPVVMENTGGAQNNKKANLYKTELCHSFEETGHCRYGSKCQFAHSESELRHVDRHPKYKTEICKTFWEQGTCPYGKRCCFIHKLRDVSKKEEVPTATPTTPVKKNLQESSANVAKPKVNSTDNNTLSEGETIAVTGEEGEITTNNHSRSGSDSTTAASITEEVIASPESESKTTEKDATTSNAVNAKSAITGKIAATTTSDGEKVEDQKEIKKDVEVSISISTDKEKLKATSSIAIKTPKSGNPKVMASSYEPLAKTPTSSFNYSMNNNYSSSFNSSMNNGMMNGTPRRKPSSGQPPRLNSLNKSMNLNVDMYNGYNGGIFNMNSMSYQPASPLDTEFMFNNNNITDMSKTLGQNGMSTSFPANEYLDEKMMYKLQNLNIQNTPPHTPVNNQRASQSNIFMKQPLNINANQGNSNLFLKQAVTASPFTPGSSGSFLSPKQAHMVMGIPPIPMIDDETSSLKGSVSGKGSDYGDETRSNGTEDGSSTIAAVGSSSGIFLKQAGTPKAQTTHPFLKVSQNPSTPKNSSFLPSTPQSISSNFLNNVSPLPSSRMGTSLPTTPMHPNSYGSSTLEDIFNGSDFSRPSSTGINVAASPFTPSTDLTQYMMQMASNRENSLDSIKSPSQLFYRQSSTSSLNPINTTSSMKGNGGFGNMNMGGMGMAKNRSDSFDYGIISPNGMNNFLTSGNAVASPSTMFNNPLASSFNNSYINSKRSESVDFGQMGHNTPKDNHSMVGSMPSLSFLQSINEGIPDSPFSNNGSIHGSPINSANAFIDLNASGMNDFGRRKSYPESSLMSVRLPTVPEGRHPNVIEEEEEHRFFSNNTLTDEGILKFSKEHFGLDDKHSKSLLGAQGGNGLDIKGSSILGGNIFHSMNMSPSTSSHNFF